MTFEERIQLAGQFRAGVMTFASGATTISDKQALSMASLFPVWPDGVNEDGQYIQNQIVQHEGQLYRIAQPTVTPQSHQTPSSEGMLAVYRPIDVGHEGTLEDPIPWVYGMDCYTGKYYSYNGNVYKCAGDMIACVWEPGSAGLWQWELVAE